MQKKYLFPTFISSIYIKFAQKQQLNSSLIKIKHSYEQFRFNISIAS